MGACRLCVVEVGGSGRLAPACTTPVQDGIAVVIHSPRLAATAAWLSSCCWRSATTLARSASPTATASCSRWPVLGVTTCAIRLQLSGAGRGHFPRALRAGPQPLHPVHALRARVCGRGRRARLGHVSGGACIRAWFRELNQPWGRGFELHPLRQVRGRLPHRRAGGKGPRGGGDDQAHRSRGAGRGAQGRQEMSKMKLATMWLDGCSGCHMSLLDLDEGLLALAGEVGPGVFAPGGRAGLPRGRRRSRCGRRGFLRGGCPAPCAPPARAAGYWWPWRLRRYR